MHKFGAVTGAGNAAVDCMLRLHADGQAEVESVRMNGTEIKPALTEQQLIEIEEGFLAAHQAWLEDMAAEIEINNYEARNGNTL